MDCVLKGNVYVDDKGKSRKPICKKYGYRCVGEANCKLIIDQQKIIKKQISR